MTALNIHVFVCPGYLCHRFVTQHERERGEEEKEREGERDSEGEREREERESVRKHSVLNLTIQHLWKCQPTNSPSIFSPLQQLRPLPRPDIWDHWDSWVN